MTPSHLVGREARLGGSLLSVAFCIGQVTWREFVTCGSRLKTQMIICIVNLLPIFNLYTLLLLTQTLSVCFIAVIVLLFFFYCSRSSICLRLLEMFSVFVGNSCIQAVLERGLPCVNERMNECMNEWMISRMACNPLKHCTCLHIHAHTHSLVHLCKCN